MANRFQLKKLTARCELWIMQHYHASPSSKRVLAALGAESQLRIYKCAEGSRRLHGARGACWTCPPPAPGAMVTMCCTFARRGCAEAKATCTARCQACGRVLMQGEAFHISKALASCGHDSCTGCVKARVMRAMHACASLLQGISLLPASAEEFTLCLLQTGGVDRVPQPGGDRVLAALRAGGAMVTYYFLDEAPRGPFLLPQ